MSKQGKSRKPLIIGIIAAVVILAALLAILLTNCVGQGGNEATTESTSNEVPTYQLYWNVDKAEYAGKSEAGMSSREPDEDGMFSVRFVLDGEMLTLRVANRRLINTIDVNDVMGLEFDDKGVVVGVLSLDDMPLEKVGWQFYVQSTASKIIKLNSSEGMNGMEVLLEGVDPNRVWDMTGKSGEIGCVSKAIELDKVMAVQNLAGEVTHVFIYERTNFMLTHDAYCEHCKQTVTWKEWVRADKAPTTDGHYQLHTDITANGQVKIAEDAKLCLDLNGHRIDGKANLGRVYSMFNPGITFAVMDTSEEQTGAIAAHGRGDQGMCVWVRYGAFYLYSGTLDASDATTNIRGAAVEVATNAFGYMYGGKLVGGTASYKFNESTGKYSGGNGGNLSVLGKFVMYDGIIENGKGDARVEMKNGNPSYSYGAGGNVYIAGVFEMHGGTIRNGRTANVGGNVYITGSAEVTMDGGTISGGTITGKGRNGGSVYVGSTKAVFNMNGGSIVGGSCRNGGGVVYCNGTFNMRGGSISGGKIYDYTTGKLKENSSYANFFLVNGTLNMSGGKIAGGAQATDSSATDKNQCTVNLSGSAKIFGAEGERGLTISSSGSGVKVKVGTMSKGAKVGIYTTQGVFSEPTKAANVDKFFSNIEGADVVLYNDCLALGAVYCLCGASKGNDAALDQLTHKDGCTWKTEGDLLWQPYTGDQITKDSNVYLTKDMNVAQRTIGVAEKKDKETGEITQEQVANKLNLDLNGHTLAASKFGTRVFYVMKGSSLTITDSGVGGTMKGMGHKDQSGVILMGANTSVTMIDGTLTMEKGGSASSGGISQIPASGTFTIYNGTVSNGSSTQGGNFDVIGKLYIYNGKIVGGTATNVYNEKTGKTAYGTGGNLNVREKAQVVIAGNTQILDGECVPAKEGLARANGGNIAVGNGTTVTIRDNALISGGVSNNGGNIVVYGHLIVEGGTIRDGLTKNASGSITSGAGMNIAGVHKTATIDIRGGKIAGGVYMNCYGTGEPNLKLSGAPVIDKSLTSEGVRKPAYSVDYRNSKDAVDPAEKIDVSGLTKGAKIGIYAYSHFGTKANTTSRGYFFSEVKNTGIALIDGGLYLGEAYCLCGASKGNDTALKDLTHKAGCTWETEGELLWQPYTGGNILKSGNYFLADKVTTNQAVMGQAKNEEKGLEAISVKVNLDLNGQTWESTGRILYLLNESKLTITDSVGGGIMISGGHKDQSGALLTAGSSTLNIIDGTITMAEGKSTSKAGIMEIGANVTVNMYGGTIANGATTGNGGNLNVKGTFNMYGGEISGGKANGTGGNINIEGSGKVLITGNAKVFGGECIIFEEGTNRNNGGNIRLDGELTISGNAEIYGGIANNGGNIATYSHLIIKDNVKIYDGITTNKDNNTTPGSGMNISAISAGHIDIRGGQIAGGVYINCYGAGEPQVSLSGAPVIDKSLTSDGVRMPSSSLDYRNGKSAADPAVKIDVSGLTDGARIGIAAYDHFAVNANETIKGYFFSDINGTDVSLSGTDLRLGTFYCLCGASKGNNTALDQLTHKLGCTWETEGELKWQPYVDGGIITVSGNYFLTGTVERKTQIEVKNSAVVNLDLNGQTIRSTARAFRVYETGCLTITDSGTNGTVIANGTTDQSGIFLLAASKSLTLIDGTYYIHRDGTVDKTASRGGIAEITSGVTVRVYGGEIYGGKSNNNGGIFDVTGNATARGTLEIYGGTISAGTAAGAGGCIMVNQYGTVKIFGGTITGGTSANTKGGNIAVANGGILEISGNATIAGGVYVNSNNVKLSGNALTIDKGTTAQPYSLQVVADRTVDVKELASGATVKVTADAGQAFAKNATEAHLAFIKNDNGEDVLLQEGKLYTALHANITGCVCGMPNGQHLSYNADGTTVKCDEVVHTWKPWASKTSLPTEAGYYYLVNDVTLSTKTTIGANIAIDLHGKTITASSAIGNNQAILVSNGKTLTLTNSVREDGKVVGGIMNSNAYTFMKLNGDANALAYVNLYHIVMDMNAVSAANAGLIETQGELKIYGDTVIKNGNVGSGKNGGNLKIGGRGIVNLYSGEIRDGRAMNNGGNINIEGTLNMYGGTITGGSKYDANGLVNGKYGNFFSNNGKFNLYGGTIDGDIGLYGNSVITLKGGITINKGAACGILYKADSVKIAGALTGKVEITFETATAPSEGNPVVIAEGKDYTVTAADAAKFTNAEGFVPELNAEGKVQMVLETVKTGCVCGMPNGQHLSYNANGTTVKCDEVVHTWKAWASKTSLPTEAGYYYLVNDVTLSTKTTIGADIAIDLHGKTITASSAIGNNQAILVSNGKTLTLTNSVREDGKVVGGIMNSNTYTFMKLNGDANALAYVNLYHIVMDMNAVSAAHAGLIETQGQLNIYGDTVIKNGKVGTGCNGGNMKIGGRGIVNLYSGEIRDGRAMNNGGNINIEGTLNMYGGTITGGSKYDANGLVNGKYGNFFSNNGKFNLYGGTIDGDIGLYGNSVITLKGGITINKGAACGIFYKADSVKIAGALTGNVEITFDNSTKPTEGNPVVIAEGKDYTVTAADAAKFTNSEGFMPELKDGKVQMSVEPAKTGCICGQDTHVSGCTETSYEWKKWDKADSLPAEAGNYYLTKDVTLTAAQAAVKGANIQLDLNGKTVTVPGNVAMYTVAENDGTAILVTDTTADAKGKIEYTGAISTGILELAAGNTGKLFRGTVVLDDTVTFDSFLSTGAISAANAAKISTKNGVQNVYVFPEELANASTEAERLYIGKIGCICGNTHNTESLVCDGTVHIWTKTADRATGDGGKHYNYLADAMTVTAQLTLNNTGTEIYLDLNGFNINANGGRVYRIQDSDTVVLTNTSAKQSQIIVNNQGDQGRILWGQANAVVRVYNVDVAMAKATLTKTNAHQNGIAFAFAGANANAILQNVDFTADAETKAATNGMYLSATSSSNVILKSCTMTGGYANRAHLIGTSTDERSDGNGGAIYVGGTAKVKLIDTSITGNTAARSGAGVHMDGGANATDTPELTLAGSTTITGNKLADNTVANLRVNPTGTVKIEEGFSGTVGVSGTENNGLFPGLKKSDALVTGGKLIIDNATGYQWVDFADGLGLGSAEKIYRCECGGKAVGKDGHTCVDIEWTEWTSDTALPSTTGNYVLTENITATGQVALGSGKTVRIDLNGKDVHMDYTSGDRLDVFRTYRVDKGAVLTITDSTANPGTFTAALPAAGTPTTVTGKTQTDADTAWATGNSGMLLWVYGGTATVYDGIFDGSTLNGKKAGMVVWMYPANLGDGVLTIYGGTFKGATTTNSGGIIYVERGSTLNIKGGTFNGGNVGGSGGAIYAKGVVNSGTTYTTEVNISGGTITGGQAGGNGGNIGVGEYASVTLSGTAQVTNGQIRKDGTGYGGNIFVAVNAELEMTGGEVKGGFHWNKNQQAGTYSQDVGWRHSNVSSEGTFTMTGGKIDGRVFLVKGTANISGDAHIYANSNNLSVNKDCNLTIGALTDKAKLKFMATNSEMVSIWKGTTPVATAGEGLTAAMVSKLELGVYQGTASAYYLVLEDGKLYYTSTPAS